MATALAPAGARVHELADVASSSVLPRNPNGAALVRLPVPCEVIVDGRPSTRPAGDVVALPTGGPHGIRPLGDGIGPVADVLVGDVWVLAGQSNMQGSCPAEPRPALPSVRLRGLDEQWVAAAEPLHRLYRRPDLLHLAVHRRISWAGNEDQYDRELPGWCASDAQAALGGRGPGYAFAEHVHGATGVPVGLVACALGASGLEHWEQGWGQRHATPGGDDLYSFLVRAIRTAGPVRGVLWYQGETDATPASAATYPARFASLVAAVRRDCNAPDLPFLTVQLAPVDAPRVRALGADLPDSDEPGWTVVREAQRRTAQILPRVALTSAIDLHVHDGIHLDADGADRVGVRLARLALDLLANREPCAPTVAALHVSSDRRILEIEVRNVSGSLHVNGPCDFLVGPAGPRVTRVDVVGGDVVRLTLSDCCAPGATLAYAPGFCPQASIADDLDQPLPAFGPLPFDGAGHSA